MFLKRIELSGFKSFADKTVIQFDSPLTGIVGPNGCGKSNVTDAVRWVLGEQSAKSLRSGASITDIIFSGSQSRKAVNTAKATLVFDNTARIFDSPFDEIEITRQISRGSSEISNFINRTPCRLKDIQDLVLDTGLGRDSLSMISQGNITAFADSKPEERRLLFEEAAGVAKYKKRKKISLAKLETVKANLDRLMDLVDTYVEQIESLEEQAQKARAYMEARDELASIEISLLTARIQLQKQEEESLRQSLQADQLAQGQNRLALEEYEEQMSQVHKQLLELDQKINADQMELARLMQEALSLQKQKAILDERRKMALDSEDLEARKQSLLELFAEAKYEVEDRKSRLQTLKGEVELLSHTTSDNQRQLDQSRSIREKLMSEIHQLSNKLAGIESRLAHPPNRQPGVTAVLQNRRRLSGIHGLVKDLITCPPEYEQALATALGTAADQIVVDQESNARQAINWLKGQKAGRATFLPLSVCKGRTLQEWQLQKAQETEGVLGVVGDFVDCASQYDRMRSRLLDNILLAQDLESANKAARKLNQSVKIVTLDGDVVHAGGAMSGGYNRSGNQMAHLKADKARLDDLLEAARTKCGGLEEKIDQLREQVSLESRQLMQKRIDLEKLDNILHVKQEKYDALKAQLAQLDVQAGQVDDGQNEVVARISALHARQDALNSSLKLARDQKQVLNETQAGLQNESRKARIELTRLDGRIQDLQLRLARIETRLEQDLLRLGSDYSLTYEAALAQSRPVDMDQASRQVQQLRKTLNRLGDVNLQAPAQLEEVQEKHTFLTGQMHELEEASRQILAVVDEMDQTMIEKFSTMFDRINECLEEVFQAMFGGGKARLVLCDPDDLLNTGIDVDVQPPGKAVKNLQTFSGGEKALIAISVLFAILKARTVPLCIFDEVEAALDQANVERFARYLANFKEQSQFIAVTHRPGTMEQCDALYGVTMQKDGVSQVLKVLLKDAREMNRQV